MDTTSSASLRIHSSIMSADDISAMLSTQADVRYDRGTPVSPRNPSSKLRDKSIWILKSKIDPLCPLDCHIDNLLYYIDTKRGIFQEMAQHVDLDIVCSLTVDSGQGSIAIAHEQVQQMALLQIDVFINFVSV